ncbi:MAG: valine--tRNA ligase [Spirochaetales bacterium]
MKAIELSKAYDPKEFESRIYRQWEQSGAFTPESARSGAESAEYDAGEESVDRPFVVVIPPPNVTGVLHMGHGLNNTLQDVLVRFHRMLGRPTLWVPGTDHAGIATQNVVEKKIREEGGDVRELGRERFLERTWQVKEEHHEVITRQLKTIGASCDWSRERFTMDEGLSRAVREVFVTLYERGLIYRGEYLVNWSCAGRTALSDDEVEYETVNGTLTHIEYPLSDGSGSVKVATTRPETMLGDTAVAVHPEDERYAGMVGKMVTLPLSDREIPIIADEYVDREFGTGAVKITPAHDYNDYDMGVRHDLPRINILNEDGTLNEHVPEAYRGLSVVEGRTQVVKDLEAQGFLVGQEPHQHQVGHNYRHGDVVEPFLSEQWFVRMKPLAEKALSAWKDGKLHFYPAKWATTYTRWLENIRDWCISRQLWWGHRIPVWYCDDGSEIVSREEPEGCPDGSTPRQDEDVLDTWFSSWLWPFSTLGWPEQTDDLSKYYPTTSLVTAYDIIFFWVARMIMAGVEFMDDVPFSEIYIHGVVRDKKGRKMSKSLGNGIDPLDVVDRYGADAHKFTLAYMAAKGQDILLAEDDFAFGSRFANKIWNASRYILMNIDGLSLVSREQVRHTDIDRWIYHRLNDAIIRVRTAMKQYRFNDATSAVFEWFWNDYCDWYVEASKLSLYSEDAEEKNRAASVLLYVLEEGLRLLHPFISFITEELYSKLPVDGERSVRIADSVITAPYPRVIPERDAPELDASFITLQEAVRLVRTMRSEFTIPPSRRIRLHIRVGQSLAAGELLERQRTLISSLCSADSLEIDQSRPDTDGAVTLVGTGFEVYAWVRDLIDIEKETAKLEKQLAGARKQLESTDKKLSNEKFLAKAGDEVVAHERSKREELVEKVKKLEGYISDLGR